MNNFYVFIDENTVIPYNGEILKRYVGNRLIKTIANPTEEHLLEFGYKRLIGDEMPEIAEDEYLTATYEDTANGILKHYSVHKTEETETESRGDR